MNPTKKQDDVKTGVIISDFAEMTGPLGIPPGSTYTWDHATEEHVILAWDGSMLTFKSEGVQPTNVLLHLVWIFWMLHEYGKATGHAFSEDMPAEEFHQVTQFMRSLETPEYESWPIEELVPRFKADMAAFWKGFAKSATPAGRNVN